MHICNDGSKRTAMKHMASGKMEMKAGVSGANSRRTSGFTLVETLGVSRSLLDQRFREFRNETTATAITARRLKEVAQRLCQTKLSIRAISASCGFQNPNHLKNLFKRKYGMSMREWRAKEGPFNGR